ncbi:hypothetical protein [Flavobacterium suncheonense]|uniref:hypothetical protein n=1 Tax=Flavobacterium suncheonense TaxID=350894 RepID=UPI003FA3D428
MKKKIVIFIFSIGLVSCTTLKQLSNQKIENKIGCSDIILKDRKMLINIEVDNKKQVFLFDTGATLSVITDTATVENYHKKEKGSFGSMKGANQKKTDLITITSKLNSELFYSENKILANLMQPQTRCQKKEIYGGIIGLDVAFIDGKSLFIDFSNNKLCNIRQEEKENLISKGYSKVKSECTSSKVYIFINIEGKEYRFKLDTGYYGNIIIPYNGQIDLSKYNSLTYEGSSLKTINSTTNGEEIYYENVGTAISDFNVQTNIHVSKTITAQNLGLTFMKGFDWIIDFDKNEVYVRRNETKIDFMFNTQMQNYSTMEKNGKLIISSKLKQLTKYSLGDEITEVNDQPITQENICDIQKILNQTNDWESLKVVVKSSNGS